MVQSLGVAVENDRTIYRAAVNIATSIVRLSQVVVTSCFLLMAQVGCVIYMKSDPIYAHVIVGVMVVQFFFYGVGGSQASMFTTFPCIGIHCLNDGVSRIFTLPYGTYSKASLARIKESAVRLGAMKAQEVSNNFGAEVVKSVQDKIKLKAGHDLTVDSAMAQQAQDRQSADEPQSSQVREALRQKLVLVACTGYVCISSACAGYV